MSDSWIEHRPLAGTDLPPQFVVTGDTRTPEELAAAAGAHSDQVGPRSARMQRVPVPTGRTRPWRPEVATTQIPARRRSPRRVARILLILAGPVLIVAAALVLAPRHTSPDPPPARHTTESPRVAGIG